MRSVVFILPCSLAGRLDPGHLEGTRQVGQHEKMTAELVRCLVTTVWCLLCDAAPCEIQESRFHESPPEQRRQQPGRRRCTRENDHKDAIPARRRRRYRRPVELLAPSVPPPHGTHFPRTPFLPPALSRNQKIKNPRHRTATHRDAEPGGKKQTREAAEQSKAQQASPGTKPRGEELRKWCSAPRCWRRWRARRRSCASAHRGRGGGGCARTRCCGRCSCRRPVSSGAWGTSSSPSSACRCQSTTCRGPPAAAGGWRGCPTGRCTAATGGRRSRSPRPRRPSRPCPRRRRID